MRTTGRTSRETLVRNTSAVRPKSAMWRRFQAETGTIPRRARGRASASCRAGPARLRCGGRPFRTAKKLLDSPSSSAPSSPTSRPSCTPAGKPWYAPWAEARKRVSFACGLLALQRHGHAADAVLVEALGQRHEGLDGREEVRGSEGHAHAGFGMAGRAQRRGQARTQELGVDVPGRPCRAADSTRRRAWSLEDGRPRCPRRCAASCRSPPEAPRRQSRDPATTATESRRRRRGRRSRPCGTRRPDLIGSLDMLSMRPVIH